MKAFYRLLFPVLVLLVAGYSLNARAEAHEYVLDNGLKLLVKEDHRAPVVVSQVWYKVGSSYEYNGITGVSHALEHMMFKGTEKHPAGEFSRIISENGGRENAFTGDDYTAYFQTLEKSRLPISFELEADRMRNLTLPEDEFEKEIRVVQEERRWRTDDNPRNYTYETLNATAFQSSPYRIPTIGWMHDLKTMTIDELSDWYERWYAPNNATVVVVGDVDPDEVHRLAKEHFGPLPAGEPINFHPRPDVEQQGIKRVVVKRPAELPHLYMGYKVSGLKSAMDNPDKVPEWEPYALEVLAGILDGGTSARFTKNLVRGKEIAASIGTSYSLAKRLDGLFVVSAVPANGHTIDELEAAIRAEINDLVNNLVDEKELERVKAQVVAEDVYEKDSAFYQGMVLGIFETVGLPWQLADEYVDKVKSVSAEQVREVAGKYLVDDRLTVAELEPQPLDQPQRQRKPAGMGAGNVH